MTSKTYTTPDGIIHCTRCDTDLLCDENGEMPTVCPRCGAHIDYSYADLIAEAWICTDSDSLQYRRRIYNPYSDATVFELAQINQCGDDLYKVAHGFVYDSDIDFKETNDLCDMYGLSDEDINAAVNDGSFPALLAEMSFETDATEYHTDGEYPSYESAAKALGELIGVNIEQYIAA